MTKMAFCYTTTELRYPSFTVEKYDTFRILDVGQLPADIWIMSGVETYDYLNENGFWESGYLADSTEEVAENEQGEQDEVVTSFAWDIR